MALQFTYFCNAHYVKKFLNRYLSVVLAPIFLRAQMIANADFDGNRMVDFADFLEFAQAFGSSQSNYDLNGNGAVDFSDFLEFSKVFGQNVPTYLISGKVTEAGLGLSDVAMNLSGNATATITTDIEGKYSFSALLGGSYKLNPEKAGYVFVPDSLNSAYYSFGSLFSL